MISPDFQKRRYICKENELSEKLDILYEKREKLTVISVGKQI